MNFLEIGIQLCAIILAVLLIYLTFHRNRLGLRNNKAYLNLLMVAATAIFFDIHSAIGLYYMDEWGEPLTRVVFNGYLASLFWTSFAGFFYIINTLTDAEKIRKYMVRAAITGVIVGTAVIWILPLELPYNGEHYYFEGPAMYATYILAVSFLAGSVFFTLTHRAYMSNHTFKSIMLWMVIWAIGTVIQFAVQIFPILAFAVILGLTVIFAELENPESYYDRETGLYTSYALRAYFNQLYVSGVSFSGLEVSVDVIEENFTPDQRANLLVTIAGRIASFEEAKSFRHVTDDFFLIFENEEQLNEAYPRMKALLSEPVEGLTETEAYRISYVLFPDSRLAHSAEDIFRFHGVFIPKNPEQDTAVVDEEAVRELRRQNEVRQMILDAFKEDRIEVYYQPIYSVAEQKFLSAEALVRIIDRDGQLIMPKTFVPVAEESDLILRLGEIVFEKVCRFISQTAFAALGLKYIEINLSVAQCEQSTLAGDFQRIMAKYGINPSRINLEITESGRLSARDILVKNMDTLIKSGVHFSLDDFGTGQSNIDYIMNMPVQIVKFDRSMMETFFVGNRTRFVIGHIVDMVKQMGMETVSEGVETKEQYEEIVALGVDHIQGFYFSRPLPAKEFVYFIKAHNLEE